MGKLVENGLSLPIGLRGVRVVGITESQSSLIKITMDEKRK